MRYTNRTGTFCALALVALAAVPSLSKADPSLTNGDWIAFSWVNGPNSWQQESPFSFTTSGPAVLQVTDAFAQGDRFEVYNEATSIIGTTSQVNGPANFMPNPDSALASPGFSHGVWNLGAGTYTLTFKTIQIAEGAPSGTAYFRVLGDDIVLAETPEPGTLLLAACGAAGLAWRGLRRRRAAEPQVA